MKSECFRCGEVFLRSDNLLRHTRRKKVCKDNYLDISYRDMMENYLYHKNIYDKLRKKNEKEECKNIKLEKSKNIECDYCNKKFSHKTSYSRHKKYNCKNINEFIVDEKIKFMDKRMKDMEEEIKLLKFENKNLKRSKNITNNADNGNIYHDSNVINGDLNINNKNVINMYGNETPITDISFYEELFRNCLGKERMPIVEYVEALHIDMEENRNLYNYQKGGSHLLKLVDDMWVAQEKEDLIEHVIACRDSELKGVLETNRHTLLKLGVNVDAAMEYLIMCSEKKYDTKGKEKKTLYKQAKDEILRMLYNNRKKVKDTYKKRTGKIMNII